MRQAGAVLCICVCGCLGGGDNLNLVRLQENVAFQGISHLPWAKLQFLVAMGIHHRFYYLIVHPFEHLFLCMCMHVFVYVHMNS